MRLGVGTAGAARPKRPPTGTLTFGEPERDAEILEVRGAAGSPPYVVRWEEDGHESLFFPGSDAVIEHFDHHRPTRRRRR